MFFFLFFFSRTTINNLIQYSYMVRITHTGAGTSDKMISLSLAQFNTIDFHLKKNDDCCYSIIIFLGGSGPDKSVVDFNFAFLVSLIQFWCVLYFLSFFFCLKMLGVSLFFFSCLHYEFLLLSLEIIIKMIHCSLILTK